MIVETFLEALVEGADSPVRFQLPDGSLVPAHFHVTEVGRVQKDFIDCGGTVRSTAACVLQVWVADDTDHRLTTAKLAKIVRMAAPLLKSPALPVEVEYDRETVAQYPIVAAEVTPSGVLFRLGTKRTACLAPQLCGIGPAESVGCVGPGCC